MSRAINLTLPEAAVRKACDAQGVAISSIESLVPTGTRLVCATSDGATTMRHKLRTSRIDSAVKRSRIFDRGMQPLSRTREPTASTPASAARRADSIWRT